MRLMVWNIQFFTLKRIFDASGNSQNEQTKNMSISLSNYYHILGTILAGNPDVFIMIEPLSQAGTLGSLATGNGADGLYTIYQGLHQSNNNWSIVPPLKTVNKDIKDRAYTEAVGVFYRNDTMQFIGPWLWPPAAQNGTASNGPAIPPPGNNPQSGPYPGRWNGTMPVNNNGLTYAAQFQFMNNNNQEIWFPNQDSRRPILTNFLEIGGTGRTFKIFSCHTTPNAGAVSAVTRIAGLAQATPGNNEVSVLAGDLNNDYLSTNSMQTAAYDFIRGYMGYRQCFGQVVNNPNGPTTTKQVSKATPNSYLKNSGLDNVFARYGANAAGAPANKIIIDRCAGVANTPYGSDMADSLANIQNMMDEDDQLELFRDESNYGHIGNYPGTSDHLAIVVDL